MISLRAVLVGLAVLACKDTSAPPPPPPPTYDRPTLLIQNGSGRLLDITLECCAGQRLERIMRDSAKFCVILNHIPSLSLDASSPTDSTYHRLATIQHPEVDPAWVWELGPSADVLRPDPVPCA